MVLQSMHECMHATRFCSGFFFVRVNSSEAFYAMKMILSPFSCTLTEVVQSLVKFKSRNSIKDSCGTRGIGLSFGCHFALHNYACSITIGVDSISSSSQGCQGLLQLVPSLQVILQYFHGFNRFS